MMEIHKYDTKTGKEIVWIDDEFFSDDGYKEYMQRYLASLNTTGGKQFYYWPVRVFDAVRL